MDVKCQSHPFLKLNEGRGPLDVTLATSVFKCLLPGNDFQFESNLFEIRKKALGHRLKRLALLTGEND